MDKRTLIATAVIMNVLCLNPGEFTATELFTMGKGFHCDNELADVESICRELSNRQLIRRIVDGQHVAFKSV